MTFTYSEVELFALDGPVAPPPGIIFSTSPECASDGAGVTYFIKGGDTATIFAEIAGCVLADAVGIPVPPIALCRFGDMQFAGSQEVKGFRDVSQWLTDPIELVTSSMFSGQLS